MMGLLQLQQGGQQKPTKAKGKMLHDAIQGIVLGAGKALYANGDVVAQKIMADGQMDINEAADLATNLTAAGVSDLMQAGMDQQDVPLVVSAALTQIVLLVCEFGERIGGIPAGAAGSFARKVLPTATADFRTKHVQGPAEEQDEGGMSNPEEEQAEVPQQPLQ